MKLANLGGRAALVVGDRAAIDVADASNDRFGPDPLDVLASWDEFTAAAPEYTSGVAQPFHPEELGPPVPAPARCSPWR